VVSQRCNSAKASGSFGSMRFDVERRLAGLGALGVDGAQRPVDDGERAQTQEVELDQPHLLHVVLVVLGDEVGTARLAIERREVGELGRRDDHAARVLAGVAGDALQLAGHVDDGRHRLVVAVGVGEVFALLQRLLERHAELEGDHLRDLVDEAVGVAEHAADVAHHGLRGHGAEGDDLRDGVAAVLVGHVVDDAVAALHAEVHVEVGHGHALGVQEALEQQLVLQRVQVRDLERIGHQRAGTGAAPRPHRDAVVLGPLDEVRDDQKIARKAHLADDGQLRSQALVIRFPALGELGRVAIKGAGKAPLEPLPGLVREQLVDGLARRYGPRRQVALAERELQVAALGDLDGVLQRLRQVGEQPGHLVGGAQVLLRAVQARAALVRQRPAAVDAGAHLVGVEVLRSQKGDIVGGHHRHALGNGKVHARLDAVRLPFPAGAGQLQVEALAEGAEPGIQAGLRVRPVSAHQRPADIATDAARERDEPRTGFQHPVALHLRNALVLPLEVAPGDETGQVPVAGHVLHQQHEPVRLRGVGRVMHGDLGAGDGLDAGPERGLVEAHQTEQVGLVGDSNRWHAGGRGRLHQRLDPHQAIAQRILGMQVQMDEAGFHDEPMENRDEGRVRWILPGRDAPGRLADSARRRRAVRDLRRPTNGQGSSRNCHVETLSSRVCFAPLSVPRTRPDTTASTAAVSPGAGRTKPLDERGTRPTEHPNDLAGIAKQRRCQRPSANRAATRVCTGSHGRRGRRRTGGTRRLGGRQDAP
jgi:hypothetical protein